MSVSETSTVWRPEDETSVSLVRLFLIPTLKSNPLFRRFDWKLEIPFWEPVGALLVAVG